MAYALARITPRRKPKPPGSYIMVDLVTKEDLLTSQELQTLTMTVRLGGMMVAGFVTMFGALAALIKLTRPASRPAPPPAVRSGLRPRGRIVSSANSRRISARVAKPFGT